MQFGDYIISGSLGSFSLLSVIMEMMLGAVGWEDGHDKCCLFHY